MIEDRQKRLERLSRGEPVEIIETLLNSMDNFFNSQIDQIANLEMWYLVIMGDHAVALTIASGLFGVDGESGYKMFLEKFVDKDSPGFDFSSIANKIHNWRNVIAHRWLSDFAYEIGEDNNMVFGWEKRDGITYLNLKLYHNAFKSAFSAGGKIWDYEKIMTTGEMEEAKQRLLNQYLR